ncbi:MAG: diguanylate cyclase [Planctomycetota bacterium]|nr:diguanylate cyclase [Planctomycetota bacterium]
MEKEKPKSDQKEDQHRRAEELLRKIKAKHPQTMDNRDFLSCIHELSVRQIELEMQNEELKRSQQEAENALNRYTDLYNFAPVGYFTFDKEGLILEANLTGAALLGIERNSLIKRRFQSFVEPASQAAFNSFYKQVFETGIKQTCELKLVRPDKTTFYARVNGIAVSDHDKNEKQCQAVIVDATEHKQAEERQRESEYTMRAILDNTTAVIYIKDNQGRYTFINRQFEKLFHLKRDEIKGKTPYDCFPKEVAASHLENDRKVFESKIPMEFDEVATHDNRSLHSYISVKFPLFDTHGNLYAVCGISTDITERKNMEEQLRELSCAVEQSPSVVVITDTDGVIQYVNPKFVQLTGYTPEEAIGKTPRILKSGKTPPDEYERLWNTITSGNAWQGELLNRKKNGEFYWENTRIAPIKDSTGVITHFVAVKEDVTERKRLEETIRQMAHYDTLTSLPNRALLKDHFTLALAHARRKKEALAVMFVDLDLFKNINDTFGHDAGDQLLQGIAGRLLTCVRETDTVSRLGGDEFTILLPEIGEAENVAMLAGKVIEAIKQPLMVNSNKLSITASVGIALFPNDGEDADTLLKNADIAMYRAKEKGRNNYQFYATP